MRRGNLVRRATRRREVIAITTLYLAVVGISTPAWAHQEETARQSARLSRFDVVSRERHVIRRLVTAARLEETRAGRPHRVVRLSWRPRRVFGEHTRWERRLAWLRSLPDWHPSDPRAAIRMVFGRWADQAIRVSYCESRWSPRAVNGQYLGLFQMGTYARGRYGHATTAWGQARAAYRYFVDSGRDWSPWSCRTAA